MTEVLPALVTTGAGVALLVVLVLLVLPPARRFTRASRALRTRTAAGVVALRALAAERRAGPR
ncbi:hypothetical protein ACU61A_07470 [Pseudonocardia sichuanensis]